MAYAFVQFLAINLLALGFLACVRRAAVWEPWLLVLAILSGCLSLGLLFEGRGHLWRVEAMRLVAMAGLAMGWAAWLAPGYWWLAVALAGLCLGSLAWLGWLGRATEGAATA